MMKIAQSRDRVSNSRITEVPKEHPEILRVENLNLSYYRRILRGEVDLSVRLGRSQSGKSTLIATTHGNVHLPYNEDMVMSLNVFRYPDLMWKNNPHRLPNKSPLGNIRFTVRGEKLKFSVDLSRELAVSQSGKSMVIATTGERAILVSKAPRRIELILDVYRPLLRDVYRPLLRDSRPEQLKFDI